MADLSKGRFWALKNKKCPKEIGGICTDCPDSCPIGKELTDYRKGKTAILVGRNNPERHPENFIDEYEAIYNDTDYDLECCEVGFYFSRLPKHWLEYSDEIYRACKG